MTTKRERKNTKEHDKLNDNPKAKKVPKTPKGKAFVFNNNISHFNVQSQLMPGLMMLPSGFMIPPIMAPHPFAINAGDSGIG